MGNHPNYRHEKVESKFGTLAFWFGSGRMFVEANSTSPHNPSDPEYTPPLEIDGAPYAAMFVFAIENGRIVRESYVNLRRVGRNAANAAIPVRVETELREEITKLANNALRDNLHEYLKRSAEQAASEEDAARAAAEQARLAYEQARQVLASATMRTNAATAALVEATRSA